MNIIQRIAHLSTDERRLFRGPVANGTQKCYFKLLSDDQLYKKDRIRLGFESYSRDSVLTSQTLIRIHTLPCRIHTGGYRRKAYVKPPYHCLVSNTTSLERLTIISIGQHERQRQNRYTSIDSFEIVDEESVDSLVFDSCEVVIEGFDQESSSEGEYTRERQSCLHI
eukprot:scaffold157508_cov60-Attheya_sp.AAC.5